MEPAGSARPGPAPGWENLLRLGNSLALEGLIDQALARWREALAQPDWPHDVDGNPHPLSNDLVRATKALPVAALTPPLKMLLGRLSFGLGDMERAVPGLHLALQADSDDSWTMAALGQALHHLGRDDKAAPLLLGSLKLRPHALTSYWLAQALLGLKQEPAAVQALKKALLLDPRLERAARALAALVPASPAPAADAPVSSGPPGVPAPRGEVRDVRRDAPSQTPPGPPASDPSPASDLPLPSPFVRQRLFELQFQAHRPTQQHLWERSLGEYLLASAATRTIKQPRELDEAGRAELCGLYQQTARRFVEAGWLEQACTLLTTALMYEPDDQEALDTLEETIIEWVDYLETDDGYLEAVSLLEGQWERRPSEEVESRLLDLFGSWVSQLQRQGDAAGARAVEAHVVQRMRYWKAMKAEWSARAEKPRIPDWHLDSGPG